MTVADALALKVSQLPATRQLEVLDFVEFLRQKLAAEGKRRDPAGLLADQARDLSLQDFLDARRESWAEFPREIPR